jgi:protein-disulfide isomerase
VLAAVAAAVLVAAIAAALTVGGDDGGGEPGTDTAALLDGIPQDGTFLGSSDAPVTLAEYADLQCPFCRDWSVSTFPALVEEYVRPGRLRLEFRGLDVIGAESTAALRGAPAAGEQDKLWNVVHRLYEEQGPENGGWVTDDLLRRIGGEIDGLDVDRMMNDRDSTAVSAAMQRADEQFAAAGLRGTPSFEVGPNGGDLRVIEVTSLEPESFRPIIDEELESAS